METLERELSIASVLYLVLTKNCNYSCKYCPFSTISEKEKKVMMTPEIARKGIDLWIKHLVDKKDHEDCFVILYGGEPLLNINTLKYILNYIKKLRGTKLPTSLNLMLDTNGSLITDKLAVFLKEHDVKATVGCDGPEEINDIYRIDSKGKGTFKRTKKAINILVKNGVETFASVGIIPESISKIDKIVEFFQKIGAKKIGFNILRGELLLSTCSEMSLEKYYNQAAEAMTRSFQNRKDKNYEYQMQKRFDVFSQKCPLSVDCGGYGNQLVIQPDGGVSNCPFLSRTFGNVNQLEKDFRIWNVPIVRKWRKRLPLYNPECKNCEAKTICGGGCPWNALKTEGDPLKIDKAVCVLNKEAFKSFTQSEN